MSTAAPWLSVAEAARRLGVDRHSLYDAVNRGEVPHRRVGRSVRIPLTWIEGTDLARAWAESEDHAFLNGRTAPDVERFAAELAAAVAVELARLLGEAAARATAPAEAGTVLDLLTHDDKKVTRDGTG
jgi:excisionase family DNA binding protein